MKAIVSTLLVVVLFSCNKPNDYENIDFYNERQINNFIKSFMNNLSTNNEVILEQQPKFCGNKLEKTAYYYFPRNGLSLKTKEICCLQRKIYPLSINK